MKRDPEKLKKIAIESGLAGIKLAFILKKIIGGSFRLLGKMLRFFFGPAFYRLLAKIYYQIFRLKKSGTIKRSPLEILERHPVYIIIFLMVGSVLFYNLTNTEHAGAMDTKIPKAAMSNLVKSEFSYNQAEELIEETASFQSLTSADKYDNGTLVLEKNSLLEENGDEGGYSDYFDFNDESDLVFKPQMTGAGAGNETATPGRRSEVIYYSVQSGDTISSIARRFGVTVNTILWANNLGAYSLIRIGDRLAILPESGVLYTVKKGDTLARIAQTYDIEIDKITSSNNLGNTISVGQKLILPGAKRIEYNTTVARSSSQSGIAVIKDIITKAPKTSGGGMVWPTGGHRITQYFSWRHNGLDIGNKVGTPLYAAADGVVEISQGGWNGGYGNTILINHGGGKKTRYGHASKLLVKAGERVEKGQLIALMGSTGRSTGPHLHFEVIINGARYNPLNYIK